jgi:SAM-dependent methyltransferase
MKTLDDFPPHTKIPLEEIIKDIQDEGIVLDVGCADMWLARLITSKNAEVIGIDINIISLRYGKGLISASPSLRSHAICASVSALPIRDSSIDKVIMLEVIEHLHPLDAHKAIKEVYRSLKSYGFLMLSTPNDAGKLVNLTDPWFLLGHKHFKLSSLKKQLHRFKFNIIKAYAYGGIIEALLVGFIVTMWHILWKFFLKRTIHPPPPFHRTLYKIALLDSFKLGLRGTHLYLKCVKV